MDAFCFKWSILAAFHHKEVSHQNRCITYSYNKFDDGRYDFSMLTFPINVEDIQHFERKNNISINVYGVEQKGFRKNPNIITEDEIELLIRKGH